MHLDPHVLLKHRVKYESLNTFSRLSVPKIFKWLHGITLIFLLYVNHFLKAMKNLRI